MKRNLSTCLHGLAACGAALVAGCAGYSGSNLQPGVSTQAQVEASMGTPAMTWMNPGGSQQLAYPRGPAGTQTFMVFVGADGKLERITGVLNSTNFGLVQSGMTQEQVQRILGPSGALWTQTYTRTNTLAWSWLYCAAGNFQNYFDVYFDATTGLVRSTGYSPKMTGIDGFTPSCAQQNTTVG